MGLALLVSYSAVLGGAERVLIDFAVGLECDLCLACPPGPLATAAEAAGIRTMPIRGRSLRLRGSPREAPLAVARLIAHAREVRRLIKNLDPDVIIACGTRPAIALLLGPAVRSPVVFEHHDFLPGRLIGRLIASVAQRAAIVVTPSHAVADELTRLNRQIDPLVVHPGVDIEQFRAHETPAAPPEFLVLGALVDWKRPDLALEVCALTRRQCPDVRLRLVGAPLPHDSGELEQRLRRRAACPDLVGAVEFAGAVADPRPQLERASVLLHCSPREPFGIAIIEALASGRPAVVPAAGGPAEIVDDTCGILYPPGDAAAAARGVLELVRDRGRARAMGERGRTRVAARFDRGAARRTFATAVSRLLPAQPESSAGNRLALLTVTHNSASELRALLASADRHLPGVPVVVVDSASQDETVAVAGGFAQAITIPLSENVGFGRACNRGLGEIEAPVTALVNPDVELLDDSLVKLAAEAQRGDRPPRLLAPLVLNSDGSRQDTAHPLPGSAADALRAIIPPRLAPGRLGRALAPWRSVEARPVGWAVGCALVAQTDLLRALGPFDERLFLFGEDLDLCLHAGRRGVKTWFWPDARVVHHGRRSTATAFAGEPFELLARSRHEAVERRLGTRRARVDDATQALTFLTRIGAKRALGRTPERERRQLRALAELRR